MIKPNFSNHSPCWNNSYFGYSHREHQETVEELKRKSERKISLLEEENKKLQTDNDRVSTQAKLLNLLMCVFGLFTGLKNGFEQNCSLQICRKNGNIIGQR